MGAFSFPHYCFYFFSMSELKFTPVEDIPKVINQPP